MKTKTEIDANFELKDDRAFAKRFFTGFSIVILLACGLAISILKFIALLMGYYFKK